MVALQIQSLRRKLKMWRMNKKTVALYIIHYTHIHCVEPGYIKSIENLLGFKVRLWIFVCQKFVLSGNNRIFAYGSAVPLKSLGCKSFACSSVEFVNLFLEFYHRHRLKLTIPQPSERLEYRRWGHN